MQSTTVKQEIRIIDKNQVSIDKVINVSAFDEDGIVISTEYGRVLVEGENLTIDSLDNESGRIAISGGVSGVFYLPQSGKGQRRGKGIFR